MKIKLSKLTFPIVTIVYSVFLYNVTFSWPTGNSVVGAGDWPRLVLIGMIILSTILLIRDLRFYLISRKKTIVSEKDETNIEMIKQPAIISHWIALGAICLFVIILRPIGFPLSAFIFVIIFALIMGMRNWKSLLLVSFISSIAISFLFINVLSLPLPPGNGILGSFTRFIGQL